MASFWGKLADEDDLDVMADQQTFATAENVGSCSNYLLNSLAGLGMSDQLKLGSSNPEDLAGVCNCLYALIQQRQADRDTQERLEGLATKMRLDAQASSSERMRLEAQLQEKFTELGSLEIKLRTMQQKHRADSDAWGKQADTLNLRCKQAERREQQLETKLRQQAAEAEGLRAKLRAALQGKGNRTGSGALPAEDSTEGAPSLFDTAPAALGGAAPPHRNSRNRAGSGSRSTTSSTVGAAHGGSGVGVGRNARSMSALSVGGAEDLQLQKLLEATEGRAASLGHENLRLREQLHDMRTEFEQLLARCESLGMGTDSAGQPTLPANAADKADVRRPANASRPQHPHQQHHHKHHHHHHRSHHTAAAEAMVSEELSAYLATELKSVQGRCRSLLDGLAAKKASRSTPPSPAPNSNSQQQQGVGGDPWAIAAAEAEMQEQLDDAQTVLQEQEKGLARALVALHRAEAQRSAAQQRASAAQLRSVQLEKQLTAATQEQLASGERLMELRATVFDLEAQVAKLKQLLAVREKELHHASPSQQPGGAGSGSDGDDAAMLAQVQQDLAAAELSAVEARAAAARQAAHVDAKDRELALVRRQLALMTQAVAMTGGGGLSAAADPGDDGAGVGEEEEGSQMPVGDLQQAQQQVSLGTASPAAAAAAATVAAGVPGLSALLQDDGYDDEDGGAGNEDFEGIRMYTPEPEDLPTTSTAFPPAAAGVHTSPVMGVAATPAQGTDGYSGTAGQEEHEGGVSSPFSNGYNEAEGGRSVQRAGGNGANAFPSLRLALHNVSGGSAAASVAAPGSETGGGGSSRRHRQRWDMSPCAPAPAPSPKQLMQETDDGLPPPSIASTPSSVRASGDSRLGSASSAAIAAHGNSSTHEGSVCETAADATTAATAAAAAGREGGGVSKSIDGGTVDGRPAAVGEGDKAGTSFGPLPLQKARFRKMSASTPSLRNPHQQQAAASSPTPQLQQQAADRPLSRNLSASPHTPAQESNSPGTSTNSQATLGSFVTAAGGDTPASTVQSMAQGPWTPVQMSPYVLATPASARLASGSSANSPQIIQPSHVASAAGMRDDVGGEGGKQQLGRRSSGAGQGHDSLASRPEGFSFDV